MTILDQILADKRVEIEVRRATVPDGGLRAQAADRPSPPEFIPALRAAPVSLIAEVKRRSPSAGMIRDPFDPPAIARAYAAGGAHAVSVLMDEKYFGGGADDFCAVRAAVDLPLLYKEFVVDPWQIWHAASLGASAVLLIVAALPQPLLEDLAGLVRCAGMTPLVEIHDEDEFGRALQARAECIGINNRNLKTFVTDLDVTCRLAHLAPPDVTLISESGVRTAADVKRLKASGAHAVLVGEHLLRHPDLGQAVRDLMTLSHG